MDNNRAIITIKSLNDYSVSDKLTVINTLTDINPDVDKEFFRQYMNSDYNDCFVLEDNDDNIYGYVCLEFYEDTLNIDDIIIDADCRNNGYGRKLIDFVRDKYLTFDVNTQYCAKAITLECSSLNSIGLIFYIKYGFVIVGFNSDYYGDKDNAIYMKYFKKEVNNNGN